jgi:hypothetical protein
MKKNIWYFWSRAAAACLTGIALICLGVSSSAMEWPQAEAVLYRNFGWNDEGRPVPGTVFESSGPVQAADKGELIFSRGAPAGGNSASRLPSPLGSWMALDHGDGLVSVYARLGESEAGASRVERGTQIAQSGISGWSKREGFFFALFDRRERRWVNPSMIITPLNDTRPPVIQSVRLRSAENRLVDPLQVRNISQGRYTIQVNASDTRENPGESPVAPHRIVCSVNGTETGSLNFETCSARDGILLVSRNGLVPARQVYAPYPGFEVGEVWLTRGQAVLEIIAQDIAGNSRSAIFRFVVD